MRVCTGLVLLLAVGLSSAPAGAAGNAPREGGAGNDEAAAEKPNQQEPAAGQAGAEPEAAGKETKPAPVAGEGAGGADAAPADKGTPRERPSREGAGRNRGGEGAGDNGLGEVAKADGRVQVVPAEGFRKEPAKPGRALVKGDLVLTGDQAAAVLAFADGSKVAMNGGTKVEVVDPGELRQEGGKAYYRIQSGSAQGRQVRTEFSVIGVKGTEFLVSDTGEDQAVAMAEGEVEVAAPEGQFKLYQEKQKSGFEDYQQRQQEGMESYRQEFEQYKKQVKREFVEYTKRFSLGTGKMATFTDGEATTAEVSEELEADMQRLRDLL